MFNFTTDIGIDLGTTSIVIYVEGKGIVLSEPCAAAYEKSTGKLIAVGKKAGDMFEKAPDAILDKLQQLSLGRLSFT